MSEGFPLLTTKKMPFRLIATELLWFLRGDTNIKFLVDNDCHIWDGDAFKNYLNTYKGNFEMDKDEFVEAIKTNPEFAKKWGSLGPVYGRQWRNWETDDTDAPRYEHWKKDIDQISNLIHDLKTNPDSRRLMVNAWNVGELDQMTLPPCHYGFQVYTRELSSTERYNLLTETEKKSFIIAMRPIMSPDDKYDEVHYTIDNYYKHIPKRAISLMWNQRSVDSFLGLPFNIASYGLLLEIIAKAVNMVPDELIGNLGDTHLYANHVEQAKEQIGRRLSLEERREMVTQEMFNQIYNAGDSSTLTYSEIDQWDVPRIKIREPYPLPTLRHMKTDEFYKALSEDASLFTHLDPTDFQVENYQAHPHIKAPLSN
jgi:thymidylate synthase